MKIDRATIEIRPRGLCEIIDLALLFYRRHLNPLLPIALLFGLPIVMLGLVVYLVSGELWLGCLAFWLVLPLMSGAVILTASRLVFGVKLNVSLARALYGKIWAGHFFLALVQRFAQLALIPFIYGYLLRLMWSFTPMVVLLERLGGLPLRLRQRTLYRRGAAASFGLELMITLNATVIVAALAFIIDLIGSDFLGLWKNYELFTTAAGDPLKVGLWLLIVLVVLPVVQLSWFFFYLDARIRQEGWDLELGFRATRASMDGTKGA